MSKGGGNTETRTITKTQDNAPWEPTQEGLKHGLSEARRLYDSSSPEYYGGSTVTDWSPESEQALSMTRDRALAGSDIQQAGRDTFMDTVSGANLVNGNPHFQSAFDAAVRPMVDRYTNQLAPGVDSQFNGANRMGSNAYATSRNSVDDTFARAMTDSAAKMMRDDYTMERNYQNAAAAAAPQYASNDYNDFARLAGVGSAREGKSGEYLQEDINRHNFEQNQPMAKLGDFMGILGGGYGGTSTSSEPVFRNKSTDFLGGASAGAGIGNMMGGSTGAGWGAMAGGLLGMMG